MVRVARLAARKHHCFVHVSGASAGDHKHRWRTGVSIVDCTLTVYAPLQRHAVHVHALLSIGTVRFGWKNWLVILWGVGC